MSKFRISIYVDILRIRQAWRFDIGTLFMRMFGYMFTIGIVTMMTLSGYSAFVAGTVAATLSLAMFLISPRVGKLIDERGQRRVVPVAAAISIAGMAGLVSTVLWQLPLACCYVSAALIGFSPNAQALARARWAYLVHTNRFGAGSLDLRTVYSYEGVLEDIAFGISPALNIALAASIHPVAGMVFGCVCQLLGVVVLAFARETEPEVGWIVPDSGAGDGDGAGTGEGAQAGAGPAACDERLADLASPWVSHANSSVFRLSGTVRVLFVSLLLLGTLFGAFDSTIVVFCRAHGEATIASGLLFASSLLSCVAGFLFGMTSFKTPLPRILIIAGSLFGCCYALTAFSFNIASLLVFLMFASPFYAPFYIVCNTVCERAVPGPRLTEGITTMNAGLTIGFAIGPTSAGLLNDAFGSGAGFWLVGVAGVLIPVVLLATRRIVARDVRE